MFFWFSSVGGQMGQTQVMKLNLPVVLNQIPRKHQRLRQTVTNINYSQQRFVYNMKD
jgi:hypothetical protein